MAKSDRPPVTVQVLVVGAGPVGLFAALRAARLGLDVLVIDHVWRSHERGHAALLHARTASLLEENGLGHVLRQGHGIDRIVFHVNGDRVETLELPSPVVALPQNVLERALIDALRSDDVEIQCPVQATTIDQNGHSHVDVHVVRRELVTLGSPALFTEWQPVESSVIRASFVIGADGYASRVRSALGIESVDVGPAESFAMFEASGADAGRELSLCFQDGLGSAMLPLAGQGVRWGFQLADRLDSEPDLALLGSLLAERAPWYGWRPERLEWGTVTHFERRLARRFGKGRVWLAGDAAHVTSPFGNQSMNVGLAEASALVEMIADGTHVGATASLEHYGAACTRDWHKLLGVNVSFELLPEAPGWMPALARRVVPALPAAGNDLSAILDRLGLRLG